MPLPPQYEGSTEAVSRHVERDSPMRAATHKPRLSMVRIIQMNLGFLGLQFSFGLQQGNMAPIYSYLGASEASLPLLQLAGPMTGLLVQPLIGALSDRTTSRFGRRTPYFIAGAVLCVLSASSSAHCSTKTKVPLAS